ncbi:MAG TPA: FecR family protein, partial [Pyrinomonadaceae bacterium]|nr:FecR family protein [Pyrinomonadaceae bacterium]
ANQIEIVTAPDSIWSGIAAGLDQSNAKPARLRFLKPVAIALALLLVVGLALWLRPERAGDGQWNVARLGGAPRINSRAIDAAGKLGVGQLLETDATSRAQIDVATIGHVEIDPNSRVRLLETNAEEHRLELQRGRLSAVISAPPKLFFVDTPSGVAEDLGCAYTLEVDDDGNSILHVTLGWVALQLVDRESTVPAGAACAMKRGSGPGTPYYEDATQSFRSSLAKFDFAGNGNEKIAALATVLGEARPRDAMTLWYLLLRAEPSDRASVYDRMSTLVTPPQDVTRNGVLNLDPQMLDRWKVKLSIRSDPQPKKVHSFWNKLWTETIGRIHGLVRKH